MTRKFVIFLFIIFIVLLVEFMICIVFFDAELVLYHDEDSSGMSIGHESYTIYQFGLAVKTKVGIVDNSFPYVYAWVDWIDPINLIKLYSLSSKIDDTTYKKPYNAVDVSDAGFSKTKFFSLKEKKDIIICDGCSDTGYRKYYDEETYNLKSYVIGKENLRGFFE